MSRMLLRSALLLMTTLLSATPSWAAEKPVDFAGWVSDAACGTQHVNAGKPDCIRKCMRGGASIGHPEWKPQPMVLVDDADRSLWTVRNPKSLLGHEGQHVSVTARPDREHKTLQVLGVQVSEIPLK